MTEHVQVALIASLPGLLTGIATLVSSLRNAKVLGRNSEKITEIHESTNGLLEEAKRVSHAAGHAAGMTAQRVVDTASIAASAAATALAAHAKGMADQKENCPDCKTKTNK